MFSEFNDLTDKELIDRAKKVLDVKDLQLLADELNMPRPTLAKWSSSGVISKNGTGRQYLMLFLKFKELENRFNENKKFFSSDICNNLFSSIEQFKDGIKKLK